MAETTTEGVMLRDIRATPALVREIHRSLDLGTRRALSHDDLTGVRRVVLTGCGDSLFAGVATANAFERLTGVPTTAVPSMEASRYLLPAQGDPGPRSPLLIGVSVSGEVSRTVEALRRGTALGTLTCAVTGSGSSRAGEAADRLVEVALPPGQGGGHVPGTRSYTASLLSLYLLAFHMAEVRDRLTVEQTNAMGQRLLQDADTIGDVIEAVDEPLAAAAKRWSDMGSCVVLGSGPNLATAQFMAAKLVEATGVHATASDLEEWAHLHYFVRDPSQVIIALLPAGAQSSRAVELVELMRKRGRRVLVITTGDSPLAADRDDVVVAADRLLETTSPFTLHAGTALFAAHLAAELDVEYFNGFPPDPEPNGNTIIRSTVVDEPEGADPDLVPAS